MFNKKNTISNYGYGCGCGHDAGWSYAVSKDLRKSTKDENDYVNINQQHWKHSCV